MREITAIEKQAKILARTYYAVIEVMCWRYQAYVEYLEKKDYGTCTTLRDKNDRALAEVCVAHRFLKINIAWCDVGTIRFTGK